MGFRFFEARLKKLWEKKGHIRVTDISGDYFIVSFSHEADYKFAFQEGPWVIMDHCLIVQRWRLDFHPDKDVMRRVAMWFRIFELPLEFYN